MFPAFLTVLAICASVLGEGAFGSNGRIIGGSPTQIERHPYQLSLCERNWHICGATIISPTWALTAAHCLKKKQLEHLTIRAGTTFWNINVSTHLVKSAIVHPSYDHIDYDFALVEVDAPFPLGQPGIQAIELATAEPMEGDTAIVTGWGALDNGRSFPYQLYEVELPIISRERCHKLYVNYYTVTDRMICTMSPNGGKDACYGDSGGPLVVNGRLAGVVSDGIGCGFSDFPGIYSNVANQLDWIRKNSNLS